MKILILSCHTGEGHNATASALAAELERRGDTAVIWDALSYWPVGTNRFLCDGHVFLYRRAPELFGAGYRMLELISEKQQERREAGKAKLFGETVGRMVKRPAEKLGEDMKAGGFDAVVSVHVFASLMLTELRRGGESLPTYFIATDYTCSPGVHLSDFDGCFIPAETLAEEFISFGVPKDKLLPYGIPVRRDFYDCRSAEEAKAALSLPAGKRVVLMMSGSMGCGPVAETAEAILGELPSDTVLAVVCGRNEDLRNRLAALPEAGSRLFPVGFTKEIPLYMDAAELIVTKAGGLSATEAAVKHLPMVFLDAVPGLEIHNRDFFVSGGMARCGKAPHEVAAAVSGILADRGLLAAMRERMKAVFPRSAAEAIASCLHRRADSSSEPTREEVAP